jgi:hypothetical protein
VPFHDLLEFVASTTLPLLELVVWGMSCPHPEKVFPLGDAVSFGGRGLRGRLWSFFV